MQPKARSHSSGLVFAFLLCSRPPVGASAPMRTFEDGSIALIAG